MKAASSALTFRQFLLLEDPLEDLQVELWFRLHVTKNKAVAHELVEWFMGNLDELSMDTMQLLYQHFNDSMPYDVAKGRNAIISPEQWCHDELWKSLHAAGIVK